MSSAIIGFGAIGQALARAFARKNLQVTVASRRAPEVIASEPRRLGRR
jgi:8-hydroxy-5-deazaflavin:NADPH oxidoreductase